MRTSNFFMGCALAVMAFLIWVNHLFLALKMTFCYRICCFCGNNLYISFFSH